MQIQQIIRRNNSEIQEINGNIVINTDHNILENRGLPNQHPTSAITGLDNILSNIPTYEEKQNWNNKAEINDIPTKVSELNNDSKYQTETEVANSIEEHDEDTNAHSFIQNKVTGIEEKIPNQASTENQLADKNFVNSSISTATATFKGTWNSIEEFPTSGVDDNDYVFYRHTDTEGNTVFDRYKYTGNQWVYEYTLNNSSFTAAQWNVINSGITSALVQQITTNQQDILGKEDSSNKVTTISSTSTNAQYPSAKSVYDYIQSLDGSEVDY